MHAQSAWNEGRVYHTIIQPFLKLKESHRAVFKPSDRDRGCLRYLFGRDVVLHTGGLSGLRKSELTRGPLLYSEPEARRSGGADPLSAQRETIPV